MTFFFINTFQSIFRLNSTRTLLPLAILNRVNLHSNYIFINFFPVSAKPKGKFSWLGPPLFSILANTQVGTGDKGEPLQMTYLVPRSLYP